MVEHNVTCLEVAIEEAVANGILIVGEILGKEAEVGLELQFVEVDLGGFQEKVFEVVQVEEYAVDIELGLRIAVGVVESAGTSYLDVRQLADGTAQQLLLLEGVAPTSLASATDGIEE